MLALLPLLAAFAPPPEKQPAPPLWPLPAKFSSGADTVHLVPSAAFFTLDGASPLLTAAFGRYAALTFPHTTTATAPAGAIHALAFAVDDLNEDVPQFGMDETYTLSVSRAGATVAAKTVWGALRALETFSQLATFDFATETYAVESCPWRVADAPRFPHRGLMIDSARHFQPLASIRAVVDSLPYAKLNVLHWHVVDSQSFPFHSVSSPKLWDGAYSERERYTHADIAGIVEYGRLRGIRVMVEFDMPGHAQSWCVGYPSLCPSPTCLTPLDVSRNSTFDLIEGLLGECTGRQASRPGAPSGLFPEGFIHLGGDEVSTACWSSTPRIASWLSSKGLTPDQGYALFVKRTAAIAMAHGRRPLQWSEVYDHFKTALPKEVIGDREPVASRPWPLRPVPPALDHPTVTPRVPTS